MYRHRNRPKYSEAELAELYSVSYDHTKWPDHILRVQTTIEVGEQLLVGIDSPSIADLSCGNAVIASALADNGSGQFGLVILGDYTPGYEFTGPIEETIDQIPKVDLFVFSESAEHLDDPDLVLRKIRGKADKLLVSTPNCSWPDPNPEHYWSWDQEAVQGMLIDAGWSPKIYEESYYIQEDGTPLGYRYQIYGCV